jgi:hypothetical protein
MKKISTLLMIVFITILFVSCEESKESEKKDSTKSTDSEKMENETEEVYLSPDSIDSNTPIPVDVLKEAVMAWDKIEEVTITGYGNFYLDSGLIETELSLKPTHDSYDILVECKMAEEYSEPIAKNTPLTIRGKINDGWANKVRLIECVVVEVGGEIPPADAKLVAQKYAGENVNVAALHKSYFGWNGVELIVEGYYDSHTTSTTSYGTTIRVDLSKESMSDRLVGCELTHEVPDGISNNRVGVQIKGKVNGIVFGNVSMIECKILNR